MYRVVYASSATRALSDLELVALLSKSRKGNGEKEVTGLLLHRAERFLQVLEGERSIVEALYNKISKDTRHTDCRILLGESIKSREFADWSMGFENLDQMSDQDIPGLSRWLDEPLTPNRFLGNRSALETLLELFRVRA